MGAFAQSVRLFGWVTDAEGQGLEGAHVKVEGTGRGIVTIAGGYYEIKVPADTVVRLRFSYAGVAAKEVAIRPRRGRPYRLDVRLPVAIDLREVTVRGRGERARTGMHLSPMLVGRLATPTRSVEAVLATLPGVAAASELSSAYSVRGGNYDENLIYIDGIEVYRPQLIRSSQQEGLSVINPYLVEDIYFSRGGFEARYGDKLSSVLDIRYRRPDSPEGKVSMSLLEGSGYLGWRRGRLRHLMGLRYRSTAYLLGTLDVRGEYQPRFGDLQSIMTYRISQHSTLRLFNYASLNHFLLVPQSRTTEFGTSSLVLQLYIDLRGSDIASYRHQQHVLTWDYRPRPSWQWRSSAFYFQGDEAERMDVVGAYRLSEIDKDPGSETYNEPVAVLGVGAYLDRVRNRLRIRRLGMQHQARFLSSDRWEWRMGMRTFLERIDDRLHEWRVDDSAGLLVPLNRGHEIRPPYRLFSTAQLQRWFAQGYGQVHWVASESDGIYLTGGIRALAWQYGPRPYLMPRFQAVYHLHQRHNRAVLRKEKEAPLKRIYRLKLAGGLYVQPPSYRELRDLEGRLHTGLQPQMAWHLIGGMNTHLPIWGRPFELSAEVFYKWLRNVNIYDLQDLRIRYYATDSAMGYARGIEFHLNGEFVPRIPSWASLTVMEVREDVPGDGRGFIPRPTDQRVLASIFFQDFLPRDERHQVNLQVVFGSGLPHGPPGLMRFRDALRSKPYQRVDIGIARSLTRSGWLPRSWARRVRAAWIRINVFNAFGHRNVLSYFWARDILGNQWAVPNYLTGRRINVELSVSF